MTATVSISAFVAVPKCSLAACSRSGAYARSTNAVVRSSETSNTSLSDGAVTASVSFSVGGDEGKQGADLNLLALARVERRDNTI